MLNIIKRILNSITLVFSNKTYRIQTFTYFIPSPQSRRIGYREKQFDKLFFDFINKGYEIVSINTQECTSKQQSGMWFICTVRATNKVSDELDIKDDLIEKESKNEVIDNTVVYEKDFDGDSNLKLRT